MERIAAEELVLTRHVLRAFEERGERVHLYGRTSDRDRLPVFAFNVHGESSDTVASALDEARIEANAGAQRRSGGDEELVRRALPAVERVALGGFFGEELGRAGGRQRVRGVPVLPSGQSCVIASGLCPMTIADGFDDDG